MLGKEKCKILKEIRQRIADENDIPYVTRECTHRGACKGTCPKCESELRYLEKQLAARQALGKKVAVAALCAGLAFGGAACGPEPAAPAATLPGGSPSPAVAPDPSPTPELTVTEGEIAWPEDDLAGMIAPEPTPEPLEGETAEWTELEGDVAYIPDDPVETGNG